MVLLVDKYRPQTLDKLDLHHDITDQLTKILAHGDFPHLMFYGPSGAGKHTRIWAVLKQVYGLSTQRAKVQHKAFKVKSKLIEITCRVSNFHIEMNPSDVGLNDRHVIQEVIKEIAQTHNVGAAKQFKVVVLNEVDRLSKSAQHALRRTMERYTSTCRLIMCCESACRVIAPLRSRCLQIRVPAPTEEQVAGVVSQIASKEGFKVSTEFAVRLSSESGRNLRRAILMLESCRASHPQLSQLTGDTKIAIADWAQFVDYIGKIVCEEQSPARLQLVRGKLYELLSNCVPPEIIIKTLTDCLLKRVDDNIKHQIIQLAAEYEHRMQQGTKPIFHLEAFVAKFMAVYKRWVVETFM